MCTPTKYLNFNFNYMLRSKTYTCELTVTFPTNESLMECCFNLINKYNLPCSVEDDLKKDLFNLFKNENQTIYDNEAEKLKMTIHKNMHFRQKIFDEWSESFKNVQEFSNLEITSNEVLFSEIYKELIHSPLQSTILKLENSYSLAIQEIINRRDSELADKKDQQIRELDKIVGNCSDAEVNRRNLEQVETLQILESKWNSELTNLYEKQKSEYRNWLSDIYGELLSGKDISKLHVHKNIDSLNSNIKHQSPNFNKMEESFTVHLGAQLKTTHNLRLTCSQIFDLCKSSNQEEFCSSPIRLQTAMSLYSSSLSAIVFIVDDRMNSFFGVTHDFKIICQNSTEFHFSDFDKQLEDISQLIEKRPNSGDCYITKHSNLSNHHIVFHLVTDLDTLKTGDVSSRHPALVGFRNIIRTCFQNDISSITLPLLLVHEVSEQMTISWCLKRAELVFKCVKGYTIHLQKKYFSNLFELTGFLMELSTWNTKHSKTVTFVVPNGISQNTFLDISNLLESIFRMSNPVMAGII